MSICSDEVEILGMEASPYGNRVQIALNIKGVPYKLVKEDLFNKSDLLLASNPVHKKIPVLIHGGSPVSESLVIMEYIDEVWSSSQRHHRNILPSDPLRRADARFWAAYVDKLWFPLIIKLRDEPPTEEEEKGRLVEEIKEGFVVLEETFEKWSNGKAFFGGDNIGYLDIVVGSFWSWMLAIQMLTKVTLFDAKITPNLGEWFLRFLSHQDVETVVSDPYQLVQVHESYQSRGWEF